MLIPQDYNPETMEFVDFPFLSFLKREFPKFADHLFMYRHRLTGNFLVGGWTRKKNDKFVDIHCLGKAVNPTRDDVEVIRNTIAPRPGEEFTAEKFSREWESSRRAEQMEMQDLSEDILEHKKYLLERFRANPRSPYWRDAAGVRRYPQRLKDMKKGRPLIQKRT
jgi:hypothetical protein